MRVNSPRSLTVSSWLRSNMADYSKDRWFRIMPRVECYGIEKNGHVMTQESTKDVLYNSRECVHRPAPSTYDDTPEIKLLFGVHHWMDPQTFFVFRVNDDRYDYICITQASLVTAERARDIVHVGLPVTYCIGSDCYADRITAVHRKGMKVETYRSGGFTYRSETDSYKQVGSNSGTLALGRAAAYRDPSF